MPFDQDPVANVPASVGGFDKDPEVAQDPAVKALNNLISIAPPPPKPPFTQDDVNAFRMKFFNTQNPNANVPMQAALALAKDPNDAYWLRKVAAMSPVAQAAIRQKASEPGMRPAGDIRQVNPGLGYPVFANAQTGAPANIPVPNMDVQLATALHGPEGAKRLMTAKGFGPSAERFALSMATPENALLTIMGGGLGAAAPKLAPVLGAAFAVPAVKSAYEKYQAGDIGGSAFDALLASVVGGLGAVHGLRKPTAAIDESAIEAALANKEPAGPAGPPISTEPAYRYGGLEEPAFMRVRGPGQGEAEVRAALDQGSLANLKSELTGTAAPRPGRTLPDMSGRLPTYVPPEPARFPAEPIPPLGPIPEPLEGTRAPAGPEITPGQATLQQILDSIAQEHPVRQTEPAPPTGPHPTMEIAPEFQRPEGLINPPEEPGAAAVPPTEPPTVPPEMSVRTDITPEPKPETPPALQPHEEAAKGLQDRNGYGSTVKSDIAAAKAATEGLRSQGYDVSDVEAALKDHSDIKRSDYDKGPDGQEQYEADKGEAWVAVADAMDGLEPPSAIEGAQGFRERLKGSIEAASQDLRDELRGGGLSAGLNPVVMAKAAKLGALHLADTGLDFGEWSKRMLEDVGESIRPHLKAIWKEVTKGGAGTGLAAGAVASEARGTGRFSASYEAAGRETGNAVNRLAVARDIASYEALQAKRNVFRGLTPKQISDLGDFLISERLKGYNPLHPQVLSDAESLRIASDPAIQRALKVHAQQVAPSILKARIDAGMNPNSAIGKSPYFVSLISDEHTTAPGGGPSASIASRLRRQRTRFANPASGTGEHYETDLGKIYDTSFHEVLPKAALRDVYKALAKEGKVSMEHKEGYKAIETDKIPTDKPGEYRVVQRYVPEPVARDIEDARNIGSLAPDKAENFLHKTQRFFTGLALTGNPGEMLGHIHRQLTALAKTPPANASILSRIAEPAINAFSFGANLGTKGGALARLVQDDMSTPANQAIMRDIFNAGGGTSRAFRQYVVSKIPGLGRVQESAHDLLFSVPEGKGIKGFDMRIRVALEKIRREVEGNTDPQRIRDFSNQVGQYTDKPAKIIELLKKFNPYLATQLPMRATEMRQLIGGSGLKGGSTGQKAVLQMETLLRGTASTVVGFVVGNRVLSGKWPWENDPGHELDLNTGQKDKQGKPIYIRGNKMEPGTERALATLSVPTLAKEATAKAPDYLSAGEVGGANAMLNLAAGDPRTNFLSSLIGKAPYLTKQPGKPIDVLSVASKPPKGRKQGTQNLIDAIRSLNPALQAIPTGAKENLRGQADLGNWLAQHFVGSYTAQGKGR